MYLPLEIPFPRIDPAAFTVPVLEFPVRWYALGYIFGLVLGWWYAVRLSVTAKLWGDVEQGPLKRADIDDFAFYAMIGILLGGRIGYILFYDLAKYLANPLDIFAVWQGGMSFHGGLLGTILAMVLFARSRNIPAWSLLDVVAAGVPVGLGLVRVANFINSELWGRPTDVPWAFFFPNGGPEPRHPSQLYEAGLEGIVLFSALAWLVWRAKKLKRPKFVGGAFVAGYGLSRIIVEFFREPDAHIGYLAGTNWLTMGMILSLPMVLAGIWAMVAAQRPERSQPA